MALEANMSILVVDDECFIRDLLKGLLEKEGYGVVLAEGFFDAMDKYKQHPGLKAVLTDVNMPDKSGIDLCYKLREDGATLPIFFMSGGITDYSNAGNQFTAFIKKPFDVSVLMKILDAGIKQHGS